MKVGDVILYDGIKYTVTCFYAPYIDEYGIEQLKVVDELKKILDYDRIKVTAVNSKVTPPIYVHIPIENVTQLHDYIEKFQAAKGLWSAMKIALEFPTASYTQDDYEGQHTEEEVLWNEDDLVLNPGEKPKRFKLFR